MRLLRNALKTPDGTIIESHSRYDFKRHKDANGKIYMVDGGLDYARSSSNGDEEYLHVYSDQVNHDQARKIVTWGTRGIKGDQPLKYIKVSEMEDDHIVAVLNVCNPYKQIVKVMLDELKHRGVSYDYEGMKRTQKEYSFGHIDALIDMMK